MKRLTLPCLLALVGCITDIGATDTDTGTIGNDPNGPGHDTGTAFLMWHGELHYDADRESLEATRGIGARTLTDDTFLCDIYAQYVSVGPGPRGCPDCAFSFTTQLTHGEVAGSGCDRFLNPTMFDYFTYYDFYFGTYLDGLGFSEEYLYVYSTVEYQLTDVVWGHVNGTRYQGWYLYGYNFPSSASYNVVGDKYDARFERPIASSTGTLTYYYFFY